jgi:hypothetical protein
LPRAAPRFSHDWTKDLLLFSRLKEKQMLHIVQVVLSGIAEIPRLLFDEARAESHYVECAKE